MFTMVMDDDVDAWAARDGDEDDEELHRVGKEGIDKLVGACTRSTSLLAFLTLPNGLQSLTLQSLTFGFDFNQSLDGLTLPNGQQSLTFGFDFNQSLDGVTFPNGLQSSSAYARAHDDW